MNTRDPLNEASKDHAIAVKRRLTTKKAGAAKIVTTSKKAAFFHSTKAEKQIDMKEKRICAGCYAEFEACVKNTKLCPKCLLKRAKMYYEKTKKKYVKHFEKGIVTTFIYE
jgi:hypothetical protein